MNRRVRVIVTGIVQGVNFRHYTQKTAERLGVHGWVRNRPDGTVEGCLEGEEGAVATLIDWCRTGPPSGRVDSLDLQEEQFAAEFDSFTVRY